MFKKFLAGALMAVAALSAGAFTTDTIKVPTRLLASPMDVTVIVPDAAAEGERFPTVYLLNGYDGNHLAWTRSTRPDLGKLADKYGMVIVMPDGRDSWYWNSPVDPKMQMEDFIANELVGAIDERYPTIPEAAKRAISGLSMGGHGAMWLAVHHPDVWKSVGSMSGGVNILPFVGKWRMADRLGKYEGNEKVWEEHTVINMIPLFKEAGLNIIFDCGTEDFFADVNNDLHKRFLEAGVKHDYISRPGNHSHKYWANSVLYHLLFFNEAFNQ